jgi:outer membrane protein
VERRFAKVLGVLFSAVFIISLASASFAADDFKKFGVRIRGIYIMPDEKIHGLSGVEVKDAVTPALDFEYFVTKNFSAELVLALSKHDIAVDGNTVGSLWLLPPSLYVKYHPLPDAKISPYVGFGMNVVMPFDEKLTGANIKVDSTVGWAAKVGADIPLTKNVYLNVDAMYYNTETKLTVQGAGKFDLDINPFIIGTGIGVRF